MINIIACISRNRGIGYQNQLLFKIPEDLKLFKLMTCGAIVVMGKNTWDSLPVKPLENRWNVILTSDEIMTLSDQNNPALGDPRRTQTTFVHSKEELDKFIKAHIEDDIWIIGGQSLYEMFVDVADKIILTEVDAEPKADRFFPALDPCKEYAVIPLYKGEYEGNKYGVNIYQDLDQWKQPKQVNEVDDPCPMR